LSASNFEGPDQLPHWKIAVWALVINFVIIPLVFIGYLLTIASSIPGEIKVGFCVAALSAGMPFAPILARLAKADVSIATTLLVVLTAATIIALPVGLPFAIDAVDAPLKASVWHIAWPLLLFLLLPVVFGCGFRVWWPDLTPPLAQWVVRVAILCLLFNLNFTLVAYWGQFVNTWGTELHRSPCRSIRRPPGLVIFSFPFFESKTWGSGMRRR
jgi:bile acid:Na+ symporter, BASS family